MNDYKLDKNSLKKYKDLTRSINEEYINVHPIQRGGLLTPEAFKALVHFGDGYSICDYCLKGRIDEIENPPVINFLKDVASFLDIDNIMPTAAARESKRIVMASLAKKHPERRTVIIDSLAHYTTYLAIESNDLKVKEVPNSGYSEFSVLLENYEEAIRTCIKKEGNSPLLVVLTHVDYKYGNYNEPQLVGEICKQYNVPFLLNAAYSAGILPVNCSNDLIDFIACSGHKSMSSSGPIGLLGFSNQFYDDIMRASRIQGNLSSKSFPNKICTFLGCPPVYGAPLVTLMASFPSIVKRTQKEYVVEEGKKIKYVIDKIKDLVGIEILGKLPKIHPLTNIKTDCFAEIAKNHPKRGFFLREEFKEKKILGLAPGISKEMKINTYGLTWPQIRYFTTSFLEIAEKYHIV